MAEPERHDIPGSETNPLAAESSPRGLSSIPITQSELRLKVQVAARRSERSSKGIAKSKLQEFQLQRSLESMRVFYTVLMTAVMLLCTGTFLSALAELLWRLISPGRLTEAVISAIFSLSWLLLSMSVAVASICPTDELDFTSFMHARPPLCFILAVPPALTGAFHITELPIPRVLTCLVVLGMIVRGCAGLCTRCPRMTLPSFCIFMEVWCMDAMISGAVNHAAGADGIQVSSIWLLAHAVTGTTATVRLWRRRARSTIRFYVTIYMAVSFRGSSFACRAIDLALGIEQWDEERQLDIIIGAAIANAVVIYLPLIAVLAVGRQRIFQRVSSKLEESRSRHLQNGAFLAMLLSSYHVQKGQRWWLRKDSLGQTTLESVPPQHRLRSGPHSASSFDANRTVSFASAVTPPVQFPEMEENRPDFVAGQVVQLGTNGTEFWVVPDTPFGPALHQHHEQALRVTAKQQLLPWPDLLEIGHNNLRCMDWKAMYTELWTQTPSSAFELSRPIGKDEVIDFFVSHSWADNGEKKFRALKYLASEFHLQHGRYPTFWVDKFCIDQRRIEDGLRVLPVNVMACSKVLILCGPSYPTRLWCAWELCVLLSFMSFELALKRLVVIPFSQTALQKLSCFDLSISRCYDPNEEMRLRQVISAIGTNRFQIKIRTLGQLILDREKVSGSHGLLVTVGSGSWSEGDDGHNVFDKSPGSEMSIVPEVESSTGGSPGESVDAERILQLMAGLGQGYEAQSVAPMVEVSF
mmetsp:Transcript_13037/g.31096  ORF Transcript_13037/g.31096 Transcript_13037/m.31096 type:complete len:752 (+) Transcript_13037:78-2333(+)